MAEKKEMTKEEKLNEAVKKSSELLIKEPQALTMVLSRTEGRSGYAWAVNSLQARSIRAKIRKILKELWQQGNYNFEEIAQKLRVQSLDIQGLLDEQWRQKHGIK